MATRAKEFAKTTAKVLGIAGAVLGAIGGAIALAHLGPIALIAGVLLGGVLSGLSGAIEGGILGAVVGLFFKKKSPDTSDDNIPPPAKLGRSAQVQSEQASSQEQGQDMGPVTTTYRDLVSSQTAATTVQQR